MVITITKKELPLELNSDIKMECWTNYKMAIIKTLPNFMNWLSSHIDVYYDEIWGGIFFGEGTRPHDSEYYRDILDIEEVDLFTIAPDDIVDVIKYAINHNYYYVVYLRNQEGASHEILVYGYDDSVSSFLTLSNRQKKGFLPDKILYSQVEEEYKSDFTFYKEHSEMYYERRFFGYVMSKIKPVNKYQFKNYAADYFNKINREVYGTRIDVSDNCCIDDFNRNYGYYTGTACLHVMKEKLLKLKETSLDKDEMSVVKNDLFKLLEHKKLIAKSMVWQEKNWNISDERIIDERKKYEICCNVMEKISNMFLKFKETKNHKLIYNMINEIESLHHTEKNVLNNYITFAYEWYFAMIKDRFNQIDFE